MKTVNSSQKSVVSSGKYWDQAWSLVEGCTPVSEACDNCWLKEMHNRFGRKRYHSETYSFNNVRTRPDRLKPKNDKDYNHPLKRKKPTVYAVWSDLFHESVPIDFYPKAFEVMHKTPQHTYLILTKRPKNAVHIINTLWIDSFGKCIFYNHGLNISFKKFWPNVYLGVTAENQEQADKRIPILLQIPAAKRFVSIEPILGPIDLSSICITVENGNDVDVKPWCDLDWVILGGESGHGARPMHPDWARSVRDQCQAAGLPFLFKQWGEWQNGSHNGKGAIVLNDGRICDYPEDLGFTNSDAFEWGQYRAVKMARVGIKKAGRLLDAKEHNERLW